MDLKKYLIVPFLALLSCSILAGCGAYYGGYGMDFGPDYYDQPVDWDSWAYAQQPPFGYWGGRGGWGGWEEGYYGRRGFQSRRFAGQAMGGRGFASRSFAGSHWGRGGRR